MPFAVPRRPHKRTPSNAAAARPRTLRADARTISRMGEEVELKLNASARALREMQALPWIRKLADRSARRQTLVSVYFDTANARLREHGVTLRIRRDGAKRIQTIKAIPARMATPFARSEWEAEIQSDRPVLALAKDTALEPLIGRKFAGKLKPLFETRIHRTTIPVRLRDCEIELAIDRGTIRSGGKSVPVSEIELELKRGDVHGIVTLAERLSKDLAMSYGPRTKAERGYALATRERPAAAGADKLLLSKHASAAEALQTVGFSCLRQLALNEALVRRGDAEAIHQMRVGLRRLQAAISCFKDLLTDPESGQIKARSRWLRNQLGPARDLEVFVKEGLRPLQARQPQKQEALATLRARIEKQRRQGLKLATATVRSERYRQFVLATALWLAGGSWCTASGAHRRARRDRNIVEIAKEVLDRRTKKMRKKLRLVDSFDAGQRHKLRIAAKKLRYCTEFFAALFSTRHQQVRQKKFSKILKAIQSDLGRLNDIAVHGQLASRALDGKEASVAFALLAQREQAQVRPLLRAAAKAGARFEHLPRFWK
jgi:triphosphatase